MGQLRPEWPDNRPDFPLPKELTRSAPLADVLGEGRLELGGEVRVRYPFHFTSSP